MIKLGKNFEIDLDKLISTRMLIQANSGGGKSYAIRKLLEETHGKVQQIVIDLEGEFSSLREKYDYLLVGPDGEIPARIQTAELLAKKLLKLNVSTIIDLSELEKHERILFVKRFLDSLVHAPKTLWHPCLVVIDEAHIFCPEGAKSESGRSVTDLCTRGRKRGFCAVLATQRISKLNKDAAAECNNQMVGRTQLDIDQRRASDVLGITNKKEILALRDLGDGEFWVFGPAIGRQVNKIQVDKTKTLHLDSKHTIVAPTKTPENIAKLLKDVIDLPKEAEEELRNLTDYKNKVTELKREIGRLNRIQQKPVIKADEKAIERAIIQARRDYEKEFARERIEYLNNLKQSKIAYDRLFKGISKILSDTSKLLGVEEKFDVPRCTKPLPPQTPPSPGVIVPVGPLSMPAHIYPERVDIGRENTLGICPRKIYSVLLANPDRAFTKVQLGLLSGYSAKSGGFNNAISVLASRGLIERNNGNIRIGEIDNSLEVQGFKEISHRAWSRSLPLCPRKIFEFLLKGNGQEFTKEEIGDSTGYSAGSGGFNNAISKLNSLGLIKRNNGMIRISQEVLDI